MKPILFLNILLLVGLLSCNSGITPKDSITTKAKLANALAVDGCDWHISVEVDKQTTTFLPSDSSKEKVNSLIQMAVAQYGVYSVDVEMKYKLTGKKQTVKCGWGKTGEYDEIDVLEINVVK
ncbi:hypothetical protein [Runella sp.]|uniref:hypothetical protein n=1 Tax=Runella sp. TaxID=1960881 RepID=UPI003D138565